MIPSKSKAFLSALKAYGLSLCFVIPGMAAGIIVLGGLFCLGYLCGRSAEKAHEEKHTFGHIVTGEILDKN